MKMKNFLVYLLVTVLIVSLCVPATVEASELKDNDVWIDIDKDGLMELGEVNTLNLVSYAFSSLGIWFEEGHEALVEGLDSFQSLIKSGADTVLGWLEDGLVFLNDEVWDIARSFANNLLKNDGCTIYPAMSADKMYYYDLLGRNYDSGYLNLLLSDRYLSNGRPILQNNNYLFVRVTDEYMSAYNSGSLFFISNGSTISAYSYNGTFNLMSGTCQADYLGSSYPSSYNYLNYASHISDVSMFRGLAGSSCKVYSSANAALSFVTNDWPSYFSTNSHGGGGGSIPLSTLNNTDWSNFNNTTHDTIRDDLTSKDDLTDSEVQAIIDAYTQEVLDSLGDIQEGQDTTNGTLDDILQQLIKDGDKSSSWLMLIYNLLEESLPLSGSGASSDQLEDIIKLLEKNVNTLEDIEKDTNQIKTLLAIDTTTNFFDMLSSRIGESTETLKTKFPTSIPWDVMTVVGYMAEDPEPPVYDIPIRVNSLGVEENIHIDLSENSKTSNFSSISKISRSMLTVTFIVYLMVFTRNFTRKDD